MNKYKYELVAMGGFMIKRSLKSGNKAVNRLKLVVLPLIVALMAIISVGGVTFYTSKGFLIDQMKNDGYNLSKQVASRIVDNHASIDAANEELESRIRVAAGTVISERDNLNSRFMIDLAKRLNVDELHLMDKYGNTLYSTLDGYIGWTPVEGHPLYDFVNGPDKEIMEDIRTDAKYGRLIKYGAVKAPEGEIVQVGILAENAEALTKRFSYQNIVENLASENEIVYASFLDNDLKTVADSDIEDIGKSYRGDKDLDKVKRGMPMASEWYYGRIGANVFEMVQPVYENEKVIGVLVIGFSMEQVYASIYKNFTISVIIAALMFVIFLYVQREYIIRPARLLDIHIGKIDMENNVKYRLPIIKGDTFEGLAHSINAILQKADTYLHQIRENKEELKASNEELAGALEQLTASDEELRAQYDEIQDYNKKLEQLKKKYEIAIEGTDSAVWEVNLEDDGIFISDEFQNIAQIKISEEDDIYELSSKLLMDEDQTVFINEYLKCKNGFSDGMHGRVRFKDKHGQIKWVFVRGRKISGSGGDPEIISGIIIDITSIKKKEEYIEYLAYHDHLTELPNRRSFMNKLKAELEGGKGGAVMLLDFDNFKGINDTLGHAYGDMVLKKISKLLKKIASKDIFVSRFGGDEFLILMSNEDSRAEIEQKVENIVSIFNEKFCIDGNEIYMNFSMGITMYPDDGEDAEKLIMNADTAMYRVKNSGKNGYKFFHTEMTKELKDRIEVEKILRNALDSGGFELMYQPQINVKTGIAEGYEALLRLKEHRISPAVFIPVAEETGLITEIGKWVTREAVSQMAKWREKGIGYKTVAINISTKQLNDEKYIYELDKLLKEYSIDPECLEIEITESVLLERTEETIAILNKLKELGVKIALDDFGTGYSSLSYLTFIPVDKIKLDKSLNDKFLAIDTIKVMDSIISLAHSLKLTVTAEGIEDAEQYKRLKVGRCDYIQGYLFSRPVTPEEIENLYDRNFVAEIIG